MNWTEVYADKQKSTYQVSLFDSLLAKDWQTEWHAETKTSDLQDVKYLIYLTVL